MIGNQIVTAVLILALCVGSGIADSRGFVHASRMWQEEGLVWRELRYSAIGFALGAGTYWLSVRYMERLGVVAAEVQVIVWFAVTIIGVAVVGGRFGEWPLLDRGVAAVVVLGVGWLLVRATPA